MIKTFQKAKEDFYMISYWTNISTNRRYNRHLLNRIRLDMNNKIENLLECIR